MSTTIEPLITMEATPFPPLVAGQRLDQPDFHRRYQEMPPGIKAELIDGVVYIEGDRGVASPLSYGHGDAHVPASAWLSYYEENTPGVRVSDTASAVLGPRSELQPDLSLRILPECGGQIRPHEKYLMGAPELVVEVSFSSRYVDLGPKLLDYERGGVLEYVVRCLGPDEIRWHARRDGRLVAVPPDADGIYRSAAFPGLWLDPAALIGRDFRRLRAAIDLGIATPEHAAFLARLATPPA